jgi:catechol 2,3-dioxygenase-like lactoylglutathione lyase family enzyme
MTVSAVGAILLISDNAKALSEFYAEALSLPMEPEEHGGVPLHYGCEIGTTHFAIHPSEGWPGERAPNAQSPVLVFYTDDLESVHARLEAAGVHPTPVFDHGFATMTAFRDPDGTNVQVMTPT